jgi:hypothetical protein
MNALAALLSYGLPYCLQLGVQEQLEAARRGEPVDPDGALSVEDGAVYVRYDRITLEDNPHGASVRYYWGALDVMWKTIGGIRLTFSPGQHRLELANRPGRVRVPHVRFGDRAGA